MQNSLGRAEGPGGAPAHDHGLQVLQQRGQGGVSVVIRQTHRGDRGGQAHIGHQLHDGDVISQGGGVPGRVLGDPGNVYVQGGLPGLPWGADVMLPQPDHPGVPV